MTRELKIDKRFKEYLRSASDLCDGVHYVYQFANNYGASIIKHNGSYGHENDLWELGLIKYDENDYQIWHLVYDEDRFTDVIGYLTDKDVEELLDYIMNYKGDTYEI